MGLEHGVLAGSGARGAAEGCGEDFGFDSARQKPGAGSQQSTGMTGLWSSMVGVRC